MGIEILNMSNDFQPNHSYNIPDMHHQGQTSISPSTSASESRHSTTHPPLDPRQNDRIAAELRRMQQAREEENHALLQMLSRQQTMPSSSSTSSQFTSSQFNGMSSSSGDTPFGSSQMNNFMPGTHQSLMMNNARDMTNLGGMDSRSNSNAASQLNSFMASSFMNGGMNMNPMDNMGQMNMNIMPSAAAPGNASSSSSQFSKVDHPFDSQLNNFMASSFMNNQNNMDSLGRNDYLQKNQLSASSGGTNNTFMSASQTNQVPPPSQEDPGWEDQFKALRAYHLQFGNCKVPARFKSNPKLGRWVMTQRRQFTLLMQGFPSALTADRIRRLETLGFTWSVRPEPGTTWNKKFHELKAYKATYGNCMVPQRYQANPQLGTWVHTQRRQYKLMTEGKKSSMSKEKADALDSIGFFWAAKHCMSTTYPSSCSGAKEEDGGKLSDDSDRSEGAKAA